MVANRKSVWDKELNDDCLVHGDAHACDAS